MGKKWVIRRQQGFTLVSLAGLVVSSGIALGVAVQGLDMVSDIKRDQFYQDLRTLEDRVWDYHSLYGNWPGDCDDNGLIEYQPAQTPIESNTIADSKSCLSGGEEATTTALAEIKRAGIVDEEITLDMMRRHSQEGVFEIGTGVVEGNKHNVIVAYDVPVEYAKWIDTTVDGHANSESGRVRRWDNPQNGSAWSESGKERVTLAYYFESEI